MRYHNQSLFLIEQLQPSWLPNRALIRFYIFASRLIGGLILGFLFARVAGVYAGIYFGLIGGLCVALLDMLRYEQFGKHITVTKPRLWRWSIIYAIFVGMLAGIVSGVYLGLIFGLRGGLNVAINSALLFGVVFGLRGSWQNLKYDVRTVESLGWSWHKALKGGGYGLIIGLIWGVVYHLNSLIIGPVFDVLFLAQLLLPLSMNLMMVGVILGGLTSSVMESKTRPNQGIWLSLRNVGLAALLFGLGIKISNVVADLMITFVSVLNNNDSIEVSVDMLIRVSALAFKNVGMTAAVLAILWYGGLDIIQHYILRLILWIERDVPRNYPQFLDYCVDRIFLRRVGGGYIFIHRLLLEHFAAMNVEGK
jgi:hypothetical protein